jgi:hypothetical protein
MQPWAVDGSTATQAKPQALQFSLSVNRFVQPFAQQVSSPMQAGLHDGAPEDPPPPEDPVVGLEAPPIVPPPEEPEVAGELDPTPFVPPDVDIAAPVLEV